VSELASLEGTRAVAAAHILSAATHGGRVLIIVRLRGRPCVNVTDLGRRWLETTVASY
jgi:hypothetical protein